MDDANYIVKEELFAIPVYGWYLRKAGYVRVDRRGGAKALRALLRDARAAMNAGRPLVIFPEGTRSAPGERRPYHPGVAALYRHLKITVVPAALNSGLFWGRHAFLKTPGRIVLEFLPPIAPGLTHEDFMKELAHRIEGASERLRIEAEKT